MLVKGFVNIRSLLSNDPGVISQYGELSPIGYTYAREKGCYQHSTLKNYELITFLSLNNNIPTVLTQSQVNQAIAVVDYLRTYISVRNPPFSINSLKEAILTRFPNQINNLDFGNLTDTMPQWISWTDANDQTDYMLWFNDEAFRNQFDNYEIKVIPALADLTKFFLAANFVQVEVASETADKLAARMETAKAGYPETVLKVIEFNYTSPTNPNNTIKTYWGVLIYGAAGDNIDSIKDAIIDYIATHSNHTEAEWQVIFPDIYKRTEFFFIPQWDNIAIPNMLTTEGIYSQVVDPLAIIDRAIAELPTYQQAWIRSNTRLVPVSYKEIMLSVTNGVNNVDGKRDFKTLYPDYLAIPSVSLDFNRMQLATQEVVESLHDMVVYAETMTRYTFLPVGMKRIYRNNKYYLAKQMQGINFIVLPKAEL